MWYLTNLKCSVAQPCPTLWPHGHGASGFLVLHCLPEFAQIHVPWVDDAIQVISSSIAPFSCPQPFPALGSFPMSWLFASSGQSTGVSALASVLPMNIQGWFPLGLTGLTSLLFKGPSRVFSTTTVRKQQMVPSLLYGSAFTSVHDYWKNHSLKCRVGV